MSLFVGRKFIKEIRRRWSILHNVVKSFEGTNIFCSILYDWFWSNRWVVIGRVNFGWIKLQLGVLSTEHKMKRRKKRRDEILKRPWLSSRERWRIPRGKQQPRELKGSWRDGDATLDGVERVIELVGPKGARREWVGGEGDAVNGIP